MFLKDFMDFYLALFSNRTETMDFSVVLRRYRIEHAVIATPKGVGSSCGVCIKIYARFFPAALKLFRLQKYITFHSFYYAKYNGKGDYKLEKLSVYF